MAIERITNDEAKLRNYEYFYPVKSQMCYNFHMGEYRVSDGVCMQCEDSKYRAYKYEVPSEKTNTINETVSETVTESIEESNFDLDNDEILNYLKETVFEGLNQNLVIKTKLLFEKNRLLNKQVKKLKTSLERDKKDNRKVVDLLNKERVKILNQEKIILDLKEKVSFLNSKVAKEFCLNEETTKG